MIPSTQTSTDLTAETKRLREDITMLKNQKEITEQSAKSASEHLASLYQNIHTIEQLIQTLETQRQEREAEVHTSIIAHQKIVSEASMIVEQYFEMIKKIRISKELLIVFGGPRFGLRKILESENKKISANHLLMNMFPRQGTQTVRLEEAIFGTLSIVNNYLYA